MKRNLISTSPRLLLFSALISFLAFPSCSDDEEQDARPSIAGFYQFVSVTSATAVDLNKDGVASTNLMQEIEDYDFNYPFAKLELRPTKYNTENHKLLDISFPHPNLTPYTDINSQAIVLHTTNSLNGTGYTYTYDEKTKAIGIVRPANHAQTEAEWGRLNSLTVLGTNQLTAKVTKDYYDFQINGWRELNITVVYEKVE
ncbi:hypothetical protein [Rufibacter latericius]|uniref:Uncharacterized protein n=1 Tax=Rufibacter latericius TaxID=2487040 RepID=A0A3M9MT58_9BACT|nr:hypothetical protein [Rufibacter latericius]RNI28700.1 hypothetical protein EFB08_08690 [Rufibacter latericius]